MHRFRPTGRLLVAASAIAATTVAAAAATAAPTGDSPYARGQAALDRIGNRLPAIAARHRLDASELASMLLDDDTLVVDRDGGLAYFDVLAPEEPVATAEGGAATPPVSGPEFQLASLPGAAYTIYLDFDGHTTTGTTWNNQYGIPTIVSPPYDTDGQPDTWSSSELAVIENSWAAVAEDFAPWQVNVTTIDPGAEALSYSGPGDTEWGVRVVITEDTWANCGCGGHAYIGAFDDPFDEPAFVYNHSFIGVSEAISHEVGHTLYLAHDGTTTGDAYYIGHDGTGPGWAPIMGVGYYEEVTQWSQQEYRNANNSGAGANYGQGADDLAVISNTGLGNIPIRVDDHGDAGAAPTPLGSGSPSANGVIETRTDVDTFSFATSGGSVSLTASPASVAPNLDIALTLRDREGNVVASSNPVDDLAAPIATTVTAGSYTIEIDGAGVGSPMASAPSGYTDYGSIGQYTLTGTIAGAALPDATPPAVPTNLVGALSGGDADLSWDDNAEIDLGGYVVQRDSGAGFGDVSTVGTSSLLDTTAPSGDISYRVMAVDIWGNRSDPSAVVTMNVPVVLVSHATGETSAAGTVSGSFTATHTAGGAGQVITEADATGKPSNEFDHLEHIWQIPATTGDHSLTIHATTVDGGDADSGVVFDVSSDGSTWDRVAAVPPNGSISNSYAIGRRTGTVFVRVTDTDRSRGQRSHDRVTVDFLELTADGIVVDDPDPTSVIASLSPWQPGGGNGQQHGGARVTITDDHGAPVGGATVVVRFGGVFGGSLSGTTDGSGTVSFATTGSARKPDFSVCVASVAAALPYVPGPEGC